jgi:hypothetical protein
MKSQFDFGAFGGDDSKNIAKTTAAVAASAGAATHPAVAQAAASHPAVAALMASHPAVQAAAPHVAQAAEDHAAQAGITRQGQAAALANHPAVLKAAEDHPAVAALLATHPVVNAAAPHVAQAAAGHAARRPESYGHPGGRHTEEHRGEHRGGRNWERDWNAHRDSYAGYGAWVRAGKPEHWYGRLWHQWGWPWHWHGHEVHGGRRYGFWGMRFWPWNWGRTEVIDVYDEPAPPVIDYTYAIDPSLEQAAYDVLQSDELSVDVSDSPHSDPNEDAAS